MAELTLKTAATATTDNTKLEFAYNAQEKLRLAHNVKGQDYLDGKITEAAWEAWKKEYFTPRSRAISESVRSLRETLLKSNSFNIDLDRDFE